MNVKSFTIRMFHLPLFAMKLNRIDKIVHVIYKLITTDEYFIFHPHSKINFTLDVDFI